MSTGIKVKDAMVKKAVTSTPGQTALEGAQLMKKEDVGSIIICENKKPIGIVTREDIITKITAKGLQASSITLREIMNTPLITCDENDDIADAARKMTQYGYERIPVCSMDNLVGIISAREVAKVAPAAIEILRERLFINDGSVPPEEFTSGDCELCGNFSETLRSVNDRWVCDSCKNEAAEL
jgi:CBS domain-containing protein